MVPLIRTGRLPGPPGPLGRLPHRSVQRLQEVSSFFFFIYPSIHIRVFLMASDRCLELQTVFGSFIQELTRPHQHGSFTTLRRTLGPASSSSSAALRDVLMTLSTWLHVSTLRWTAGGAGSRHTCVSAGFTRRRTTFFTYHYAGGSREEKLHTEQPGITTSSRSDTEAVARYVSAQ